MSLPSTEGRTNWPAKFVGTTWRHKRTKHKHGRSTTWTVRRVASSGLLVLVSSGGSKKRLTPAALIVGYEQEAEHG